MQSYNNKDTRANRIANLPKNLKPEQIIDVVSDFDQAAPIISLLNKAIPDFFASEEYSECDIEHRKEMAFSYRVLMDMMARVQEFQRRSYGGAVGVDFWEPCTN